MKIHPPKLTIDEEKSFTKALFARQRFAVSLTNLLQNISDDLVIFVSASWGEGKTTFTKMWLAQLRH